MKEKLTANMEPNRKLRIFEVIVFAALLISSAVFFITGISKVHANPGVLSYQGSLEMERLFDEEDYDEDSTMCDVIYADGDKKLVVTYPYEEYEALEAESITAHEYRSDNGTMLYFDHMDPTQPEIDRAFREVKAEEMMPVFNASSSLLILAVSLAVMMLWAKFFTTYEKCWFLSIMLLATIVSVIFPEESANGVNGIVIMLLYLLDTFLNILCELLISKQSRYNFLVSVAVEITEIVICIVLMYRFATMFTTLFFWLPIDILSYINWTRHKDDEEDELTVVRRLTGWQEVHIAASRRAVDGIEALVNILHDQVCILHDLFHYNKFYKENEDILPFTRPLEISCFPKELDHQKQDGNNEREVLCCSPYCSRRAIRW